MKKLLLCAALLLPFSAQAKVNCGELQSLAITIQYANQKGVELHKIYKSLENGFGLGTFDYDVSATIARSAYERSRHDIEADQFREAVEFGDLTFRACERAKHHLE